MRDNYEKAVGLTSSRSNYSWREESSESESGFEDTEVSETDSDN